MSDDEVIRFEITDYDLDNEFNPFRGRHKKEQQIYGVWAKDSDEEDNEDNIRKRTRKPKDFSAPIGFVAGGVQQAGKKKKEIEQQSEEGSSMKPRYSDSSSEEEQVVIPDETETAGIRRKGQGLRSATIGGNLGNWEKHTKGIGAKLLLQMGYQPGKGLGKDLQGISAPIEASLRKGRGAIGAYGPEKDTLKAKKEQEKRATKETEETQAKLKANRWKKSHKGRYFYKDADDVIKQGVPTSHTMGTSELSKVPVIDMTGREKRVLSGYHALRSAAPRFEHEPRRNLTNFSAPELSHNLQVAVECCEQDIIQNARNLHITEDELVKLEKAAKDSEREVREQDKHINAIENILQQVERLREEDITIEETYKVLKSLKETHPLEYETFELGTIAADILDPLMKAYLADWDPLIAPEKPIQVFITAQILLSTDGYNRVLWGHLVPRLKAAAEAWNPRTPNRMLNTMRVWLQVLDAWTGKEVLNQVVVPRLATAVKIWSPTNDTLPIHHWLLPWHDMAGDALAVHVYAEVRSRLASALLGWHPADNSARPLLGAWRDAWGPALDAVLQTHIAPKLEQCLKTASVDLVGGDNSAWQWCVDWLDLIGPATLGNLATRALLPRWLASLAAWLNTQPSHATVLRSYSDFKKLFPESVLRQPSVAEHFRKALDMINRACDLEVIPAPAAVRMERPRIATDASVMGQSAQSFSDLLQQRCADNNIAYLPLPGRMREGRPIFRIGHTLQCYVIRNVIMYSEDGVNYAPIGLDRLIEIAR